MSSYTFFALFIQALLVQNAFCQILNLGGQSYTGLDVELDAISYGEGSLSGYGLNRIGLNNAAYGLGGLGNAGLAVGSLSDSLPLGYGYGVPDVAAVSSVPVTGPFGGTGNGELAIGGEVTATGTTLVAGQIPVVGVVYFSGQIPARGVVSIAGECGCSNVPL